MIDRVENIAAKEENAFPTVSFEFFILKVVKSWDCLAKSSGQNF